MSAPGHDVTRLVPGGVVVGHYAGRMATEGPWLVVQGGAGMADPVALIAPAHAVVEVVPCPGDETCRGDRHGSGGRP